MRCDLAGAVITKEGKPPSLVAPLPEKPIPSGLSAKETRALKSAAAARCFLPPQRTDEANAAVAAATARSASLVLAYISSALLHLPAVTEKSGSGQSPFPHMLTQNKAQAAYDLITLVSGKTVPLPESPADRKNEKAEATATYASEPGRE